MTLPPPGWYFDSDGRVRWWDGQQWTGRAKRSSARWVESSPAARRLNLAVAVLDIAAIVVAAAISIVGLVGQRPVPGASFLLIAAVPLLVGGQVWTIALLRVGRNRATRDRRLRAIPSLEQIRGARHFVFGQLGIRTLASLAAIGFLGWLAAMTALFSLTGGGPASPAPGCPYRLQNHGTYTCVTKTAYERDRVAEQRLIAGIFTVFYALHLGVTLGRAGIVVGPLD